MTVRSDRRAVEIPRAQQALIFESVARSHEGRIRALNEDRFLERADVGLWAVADGMGGHDAGEVASALVVDALAGIGAFGSSHAVFTAVQDSMRSVNSELLRHAKKLPGGGVIGSTVVVLLVQDGRYACLWAGDSRAYVLRDGQLKQMTRDHSVVQQLVDDGRLRAEQVKGHPRSNIITRAVGAADRLELEACNAGVVPGDTFLLCSDGLTNALGESEIGAHLDGKPLDECADGLLASALQRGAKDNVTFIVIRARHG